MLFGELCVVSRMLALGFFVVALVYFSAWFQLLKVLQVFLTCVFRLGLEFCLITTLSTFG